MSIRSGWKTSLFLLTVASAGCAGGQAVADQTHFTLVVAAGATSPPLTLPIANSPITMSCVQTVGGNVGTGQVTIIRSIADNFPVWNGYDNTGLITFGQGQGNHVVFCDFQGTVEIRTLNATQLVIKNNSASSATVVVMFNY